MPRKLQQKKLLKKESFTDGPPLMRAKTQPMKNIIAAFQVRILVNKILTQTRRLRKTNGLMVPHHLLKKVNSHPQGLISN